MENQQDTAAIAMINHNLDNNEMKLEENIANYFQFFTTSREKGFV